MPFLRYLLVLLSVALPGLCQAASLQDTLNAAFAYSPALKASQENRKAALEEINRARAGFRPTIGVWAGAGVIRQSDSTSRAYREDGDMQPLADASLLVTQPLYTGGAAKARMEISMAGAEAADNYLMDSGTSLAYEAVSAHADLLRRQQLLDLAKNNLQQHEAILKTVRERFSQGVATDGEVSQIETRRARAEATVFMHLAGLEAAQANYLRITGHEPPALLEPAPTPMLYPGAQAVREQSMISNPRILAAQSAIKVAAGDVNLARSRFSPTVNVQAGPSYHNQKGNTDPERHSVSAMLNVQWELYSGGADKAGLSQSQAKQRQARHELNRYADQLAQDISTTWSKVSAALAQARQYSFAAEASLRTRQSYYQQFMLGERSLIDVLDAENDHFNSASELLVNTTDALLGQYRLLALSGQLLEHLHLPLPKE